MQAAPTPHTAADVLKRLGAELRSLRKALHVSAVATAEQAGISRVTLHRIENGEGSVAMNAWAGVASALGLQFGLADVHAADAGETGSDFIPVRIALADYPQLRQLAWQVHGTDWLTPVEALGIYERNARHMDTASLTQHERQLIDSLRAALVRSHAGV